MTTSYVPPNRHPHFDHNAATVHRPQMTFVPQAGPMPRPANSSPTWKAGWVVSGLAAALSIAAVSVVGALAFDAFVGSKPAPESASVSTPASATDSGAVATPALDAPAPAIAVVPGIPDTAPSAGAPRVIVLPAPAAAPPAKQDPVVAPVVTPAEPVVAPPAPVTPPKPPLGIGTCDLVACDPAPPAPPLGIGTCDLVACTAPVSRP